MHASQVTEGRESVPMADTFSIGLQFYRFESVVAVSRGHTRPETRATFFAVFVS